jgi:hypothetical protein
MQGLAYVIHTDQNGDLLYERNRKHFARADGTPFTRPPLRNKLNFNGISKLG